MCCFQSSEVRIVHEIGPDDEPIVAWRLFKLRHPAYVGWQYGIASPYQSMRWDKPSARLPRKIGLTTVNGFYSRRTRDATIKGVWHQSYYVVAKVELSGRVIEYHRSTNWKTDRFDDRQMGTGYRSQKLKIVELEFAPGCGDVAQAFRRHPDWKDVKISTRRGKR